MRTHLTYPYARGESGMIAAATASRDMAYECLGCGQPLVLRRGSVKRPHFAHAPGVACHAETVLHATAKQLIAMGIAEAVAGGTPYAFEWQCHFCTATNEGNLAREQGIRVGLEEALEGVRPDLLARSSEGAPRYAVEVVVSHAPELATVDVFRRLGLPVVLVYPTWRDLDYLHAGLERVKTDVLGPCRSPLHPPRCSEDDLRCPGCQGPRALKCLERWQGYHCYRCDAPLPAVRVSSFPSLDDWWLPGSLPSVDSESATIPGAYGDSIVPLVQKLGVTLARRPLSSNVGAPLMQLCDRCGAYQAGALIPFDATAYYRTQVQFVARCAACDAWEPVASRELAVAESRELQLRSPRVIR